MNNWTNTYMFGVALFSYLAILMAAAYCILHCSIIIKRKFPDKRKRNDIANSICKYSVVCWLFTSFFGAIVFFWSAICMLLIMLIVLRLFD